MIDVVWIGLAFLLGLGALQIGLPPLAGYLAAGFALYALDISAGDTLTQFSDMGVTLLLFTIGLKLKVGSLLRPQIWGGASVHMVLFGGLMALILLALSATGLGLVADLSIQQAAVIAFALSFSSTVFAVKFLEDRGEMQSIYGSTTIGILIMQDIAAVLFLAATAGKYPSPWAILLIPALWPLRLVLARILSRVGHGELLVLFGLTVAIGGAQLFDLVKVKGDLGALLLGVLLASHRSADELAKSLLSLKDVFLVGFFLSVGLTGIPEPGEVLLAILLLALLPLKGVLFFWLLSRFRLRARTSLFSALGLSNYSEFGLIVLAVAVSAGWLDDGWLTTLAVALSLSFVAASPLNKKALAIYEKTRAVLYRYQDATRRPEEAEIDPGPAVALVLGMGRVGEGAYEKLLALGRTPVVAIDSSLETVERHLRAQRMVIRASGTDVDFWNRLQLDLKQLEIVILAMPDVKENLFAARQLRGRGYQGSISAVTRYEDHVAPLRDAGVSHVVNLYEEAGAGLADDAVREAEKHAQALGARA